MPKLDTDRYTRDEAGRRGWIIWKVERYKYTKVPGTGLWKQLTKSDLFGLFDYLALVPESQLICGIQSTTRADMTPHINKMQKEHGDNLELWLKCGGAALVWGWYYGIEPPAKVAGKSNTYRKPAGNHHGNQSVFLKQEELSLREVYAGPDPILDAGSP